MSFARRQGLADPGLDAGFLIRADNVVPAAQRLTLPKADVQVQNAPGLVSELRVTGKDPILIAPRLDRVGVEDAPERSLRLKMGSFVQPVRQRFSPPLPKQVFVDRTPINLVALVRSSIARMAASAA